ncbi:hypothetical protein Trydic_g10459 [Trypoxylus dichotomus]
MIPLSSVAQPGEDNQNAPLSERRRKSIMPREKFSKHAKMNDLPKSEDVQVLVSYLVNQLKSYVKQMILHIENANHFIDILH